MILTKRIPDITSAKNPPRKPKRMTIGIGMLCDEGLIIAVDTQIVMTDGSTSEGIKVHQAIADTGVYVIANATEDGNAANTLIPDIITDLQNIDPKSFAHLEKTVRDSMADWSERYRQGSPYIQIILGASINQPKQENIRTGGGIRLYNCEPPNTMVPVDREDISEGYLSIGAGGSVTDPIFRTLFSTDCSAHTALNQIAYLMYRAKKDAATSCGGNTNAVLIKNEFSCPLWIEPSDMRIAEHSGRMLDFALNMTASTFLAETDEAAQVIWDASRLHIIQGGVPRTSRFHTQSGEEVGLQLESENPDN
jgi:20S proteasome alpha/beta subunit